MIRCVRYSVAGRVQGVFYRVSAHAEARRLGLTGWVRNRPDGHVEVLACGADASLTELEHWLWRGPEMAQVAEVSREDTEPEDHQEFTIR